MSENPTDSTSVPDARRRRPWIPVAVVASVAVAVIAAVGVVVLQAGDSPAGASVRLEPATRPARIRSPNQWRSAKRSTFPATSKQSTPPSVKDLPNNASTGTRTAEGTTPGLYGGSGERSMCDPTKFIAFLAEHPSKAAAWAAVFGIGTDTIDDFVGRLTPVVLTSDTLVTNHGYGHGRATALTAVLEAGTAVMVDVSGVPRVKCNCGNPLARPPIGSLTTLPTVGEKWSGYAPSEVVSVRPGHPTGSVVLTEVTSGEPVTVPVGAGTATTTTTSVVTSTTTAASDTEAALRSVDWKNHFYRLGCANGDMDVQLTDGKWEDADFGVQLTGVLYGDVTGDGSEDAIVTMECYATGGNAGPDTDNVAFRSAPGDPVQIATFPGAEARLEAGSVITTDPCSSMATRDAVRPGARRRPGGTTGPPGSPRPARRDQTMCGQISSDSIHHAHAWRGEGAVNVPYVFTQGNGPPSMFRRCSPTRRISSEPWPSTRPTPRDTSRRCMPE